jgi:CheY-like chemotaxis protein
MTSPYAILLDDCDDVFLLTIALRRANTPCSVQSVATVEAARDYLSGQGMYRNRQKFPMPALIITDLNFAGDGGLEFLRWLRQSNFKSIPVACITGSDDSSKIAAVRNLVFASFRKSPLFHDVVEMIQQVLNFS